MKMLETHFSLVRPKENRRPTLRFPLKPVVVKDSSVSLLLQALYVLNHMRAKFFMPRLWLDAVS